jgi:hypothetical protein
MKAIPASEVKDGTTIYVTSTTSRWATGVTVSDAKPREGYPGEWVVFYAGDFPGVSWPQVSNANGMFHLPEPGDGPAPFTWHDRHMNGMG